MHWVNDLLALPLVLSAFAVIGGTVAIALTTYFTGRLLLGAERTKELHQLAGSIVVQISALHGLILALVFAEEVFSTNQVERVVSEEAAALGDVFHDLRRYGDPERTFETRWLLADYADEVVNSEWDLLANERRLSDAAWQHWNTAYEAILDLEPATDRQRVVKEILISRIRVISEQRMIREAAARSEVNPFFMVAAVMGVVLTSMSFFTFRPNRVNILLLGLYGSYTGLLIYFVMLFANPFQNPNAIEPIGFEQFLSEDVREVRSLPQL